MKRNFCLCLWTNYCVDHDVFPLSLIFVGVWILFYCTLLCVDLLHLAITLSGSMRVMNKKKKKKTTCQSPA